MQNASKLDSFDKVFSQKLRFTFGEVLAGFSSSLIPLSRLKVNFLQLVPGCSLGLAGLVGERTGDDSLDDLPDTSSS